MKNQTWRNLQKGLIMGYYFNKNVVQFGFSLIVLVSIMIIFLCSQVHIMLFSEKLGIFVNFIVVTCIRIHSLINFLLKKKSTIHIGE